MPLLLQIMSCGLETKDNLYEGVAEKRLTTAGLEFRS